MISMAYSRQQVVRLLRQVGLNDAAADALATLPEQVSVGDAEQFCTAHGLSKQYLADRMGGSP